MKNKLKQKNDRRKNCKKFTIQIHYKRMIVAETLQRQAVEKIEADIYPRSFEEINRCRKGVKGTAKILPRGFSRDGVSSVVLLCKRDGCWNIDEWTRLFKRREEC